jgi:transketolase
MRQSALNAVYDLAKRDPRVLDNMKKEMPERFFMEGVSEAAIIGMSAGLAMDGFIPYVNTIATFLTRRCYEQVADDL